MSSLQIDTEITLDIKEPEDQLLVEDPNEQKEETRPTDVAETEVDALNNNKVDVEIEPDVKSNNVVVQICSCSLVCNCFSAK